MKLHYDDGNAGFTPIPEVTEVVGPTECVNPDIPGIVCIVHGYFETYRIVGNKVGDRLYVDLRGVISQACISRVEIIDECIERVYF